MNYVFKDRLKTSLYNVIWIVIVALILDAIIACSLAPNIPAAFAVIAWVCIFIIGLYAVGAVIVALCYWIHWLFIEPFKKNRF